jgi:bacterioferritin-associated ferredoxin
MLVCHCHAVSDQTIRRCVDAGAQSGNEIREACGAGASCGSCRPVIDQLIEIHRNARTLGGARRAAG